MNTKFQSWGIPPNLIGFVPLAWCYAPTLDEVISLLRDYHLELSTLALEANVRDSTHMISMEAKSSFFVLQECTLAQTTIYLTAHWKWGGGMQREREREKKHVILQAFFIKQMISEGC